MTTQRRVILEELGRTRSHPTADDLYQRVRTRLPKISLGTVYRNLDLLSQSGLITKIDVGGMQMRFDGNTQPHYHVRCAICARVEDAPGEPMPDIECVIARRSGYHILSHRVEFVGICPDCHAGREPR